MGYSSDTVKKWYQWLEERGILLDNHNCTFLIQLQVIKCAAHENSKTPVKFCFFNFTTGRFFVTSDPLRNSENGFAKVM
ncbi:hypothetical protein SUNI508_10996 [Seiridium unicorne]|uniref:Uncharacterized protein n=1 Tax=Seiridium unicorne TaxID=138068 RepID=A0ABR2UJB2_9PEZI